MRCLERTFTEKVMAVAKASSSEHPIQSLRVKIRHLYDIHQLMQLETIRTFIQSADTFHGLLDAVRKSDQEAPIGDAQWVGIDISSCPIFAEPENLWKSLSSTYRQGLGEIVYGKLPDEAEIIDSLRRLAHLLRERQKKQNRTIRNSPSK